MEKLVKLKASSGEQMDSSKLTEEKSDDVKEEMSSSVVKMLELNRQFKDFNMDRFKKETIEIVESETLSESETKIETTYKKEINEIRSEIKTQLDKRAFEKEHVQMLEDTINTKETEIEQLKKQTSECEEKLQKSTNTIDELEKSKKYLEDRVKRLQDMYEDALKKQIEAENKCFTLKAENEYLEITFQTQKKLLNEKMSSYKTVQKSLEETSIADLKEKIQTMHTKRLEEMKIETKKLYEHQISESKRETGIFKSELKSLRNEHNKLKDEILKYEVLLVEKMRTYSAVEMKKKTILNTETILEVSESRKVSNKTTESDQKPNLLSIKEVDPTGKFLVIRSSDKDEIDISYCTIESTLPGGDKAPFSIPDKTKISLGKDLKIWSTPGPDKKGPRDIVLTCSTWGTGKGEIKVKDINGKEIILHHIK